MKLCLSLAACETYMISLKAVVIMPIHICATCAPAMDVMFVISRSNPKGSDTQKTMGCC